MAQATRISRKLSVRTITGLSAEDTAEIGRNGRTPLFSVYGVCRGVKVGNSAYGDWFALTGEFEAVNVSDGTVHNGGRLFLPQHVTDLLTPAVMSSEDAAVEFALVVGVEPAKNQFGFEYFADTYKEPSESDRMKQLKSLIPTPQELLPSPSREAAKSK